MNVNVNGEMTGHSFRDFSKARIYWSKLYKSLLNGLKKILQKITSGISGFCDEQDSSLVLINNDLTE